jgi:putative pyoverdin transport system ATP-binding/permease protein
LRGKTNKLFDLAKFVWGHAPASRYLLLVLAFVAGFSRDWMMIVVNKSAASPLDQAISFWLPVFSIVIVVLLVSAFTYRVLSETVVTAVINRIRLRMVNNLLKVQPNFIEKQDHGSLYHTMTNDVSGVAGFSTSLLQTVPAIVFLSIAVPQLFWSSTIAGVFAVVVMIGGALGYYLQQKAIYKSNSEIRGAEVAYFERVSDVLRGFRELKLHGRRRQSLYQAVIEAVAEARKLRITTERRYAIGDSVVQGLKFLLFGGIVFVVPIISQPGMAVVFQILTLVLFSLGPFEAIIGKYPIFSRAMLAYDRLQELFEKLEPYDAMPDAPLVRAPPFSEIALRDISAIHNSRETSDFALGPLSFRFRRGEVVFIVGENGSGKTTFMNLLAGLLDPLSGTIEVDDSPVRAEDMDVYRSRFSAVFTQYHVFRKLFGLEDIDSVRATEQFKRVNLHGITTVEDGEITRVDLSAGQKRRLAFAIALLEDRDILVLDEFVAEQDPDSRRYFFETLVPYLKSIDKTLIVSTHDLSWISRCDRLIRFEKGRLVELDPEKESLNTLPKRQKERVA